MRNVDAFKSARISLARVPAYFPREFRVSGFCQFVGKSVPVKLSLSRNDVIA